MLAKPDGAASSQLEAGPVFPSRLTLHSAQQVGVLLGFLMEALRPAWFARSKFQRRPYVHSVGQQGRETFVAIADGVSVEPGGDELRPPSVEPFGPQVVTRVAAK